MEQQGPLYEEVFVRCIDAAFCEATACGQFDKAGLADTFVRYKARRAAQFNGENGVLRAADVADQILQMLDDEVNYPDGAYVMRAPGGDVKIERMTMADSVRRTADM